MFWWWIYGNDPFWYIFSKRQQCIAITYLWYTFNFRLSLYTNIFSPSKITSIEYWLNINKSIFSDIAVRSFLTWYPENEPKRIQKKEKKIDRKKQCGKSDSLSNWNKMATLAWTETKELNHPINNHMDILKYRQIHHFDQQHHLTTTLQSHGGV